MSTVVPYLPDADRYESMPYRRSGRSGLQLPVTTAHSTTAAPFFGARLTSE